MLETLSISDSNPIMEILFALMYLVVGVPILVAVLVIRVVLILLGWDPVPVPWI
ncbi:MAG: hypothetical protein GWP21_03065 [Euryarchaeota archaeon]|nr:hypothetical protein [Euryarchaeota archaeon]